MRRFALIVSALALVACSKKTEPTARERVAAVLEKDQPKAKAAAEPAKKIAPDPAAPIAKAEPKPEPKPQAAKPVVQAEPVVQPKAVEAVKDQPKALPAAEVEAKVEPDKVDKVEPTTPSGQALFDLTVNDAALTVGIDNRFPTERKTSFEVGTDAKVFAWFEFKNSGVPAAVAFVWKKGGREVWRIAVDVGAGKNWRTWAEKKIGKKDAGEWTVDVIDEAGHVYETLSYTVTGT